MQQDSSFEQMQVQCNKTLFQEVFVISKQQTNAGTVQSGGSL